MCLVFDGEGMDGKSVIAGRSGARTLRCRHSLAEQADEASENHERTRWDVHYTEREAGGEAFSHVGKGLQQLSGDVMRTYFGLALR